MVFAFPKEAVVWLDTDYTREGGYFIVSGCMAVCALAAVGIMLYKCRAVKGRKVWIPLVFLPLSLVYSALYAIYMEDHTSLLYYVAGDMTVTLCLLFAGMLESCLLTGLIPTNTGYERLFPHVSAGMQITDKNNRVRYISDQAVPLDEADLVHAQHAGAVGFRYDENTILKSHAIRGGYVVWQENITELANARRNLEAVKEELSERNDILREQYRRDAQRYKLEEQNRLYDLVQRETQKQLREIDALADSFTQTEPDRTVPVSTEIQRKRLLRILLLATYIKRHKDMVIAADRSPEIPVAVLGAAISESCSNLIISGIDCNFYQTKTAGSLAARTLCDAYAHFEEILEAVLDTLTYLLVSISYKEGRLSLSLTADCGTDVQMIRLTDPDIVVESGEDGCAVCIPLAGGEKA